MPATVDKHLVNSLVILLLGALVKVSSPGGDAKARLLEFGVPVVVQL